jgi:hypothetical protein
MGLVRSLRLYSSRFHASETAEAKKKGAKPPKQMQMQHRPHPKTALVISAGHGGDIGYRPLNTEPKKNIIYDIGESSGGEGRHRGDDVGYWLLALFPLMSAIIDIAGCCRWF